jgi:hypothetical protein
LVLWLLFALAILAWVSARQSASVQLASSLRELKVERSRADAERAALLRRAHQAESRAVLVPRAEALGLRSPVDSEMITLKELEPERR